MPLHKVGPTTRATAAAIAAADTNYSVRRMPNFTDGYDEAADCCYGVWDTLTRQWVDIELNTNR